MLVLCYDNATHISYQMQSRLQHHTRVPRVETLNVCCSASGPSGQSERLHTCKRRHSKGLFHMSFIRKKLLFSQGSDVPSSVMASLPYHNLCLEVAVGNKDNAAPGMSRARSSGLLQGSIRLEEKATAQRCCSAQAMLCYSRLRTQEDFGEILQPAGPDAIAAAVVLHQCTLRRWALTWIVFIVV